MVQRVNLVQRVKMNMLLKSWRNDSLDNLCLQQVVPVILNLRELIVQFLVLIVSKLLDQLVLLVNKSAHLALFISVFSVLS